MRENFITHNISERERHRTPHRAKWGHLQGEEERGTWTKYFTMMARSSWVEMSPIGKEAKHVC